MTKYLSSQPFSVTTAGNKEYGEGWDRIFGSKEQIRDDLRSIYEAAGEPVDAIVPADLFKWSYEFDEAAEPGCEWRVKDSFGNLVCVCPDEADAELICELNNQVFDDKSDIRRQVEEFHRAFGHPVGESPDLPDEDTLKLRLKLVAEEFFELLSACGADCFAYSSDSDEYAEDTVRRGIRHLDKGVQDLVKIADALADLDYVIEGMRLAFGINGKPIAEEVHLSNMAKLGPDGKPIRREDGKILKPEGWKSPDIAGELRRQGWRG